MLVAQGLGYVRRYLELDIEEGKPGAEQALEWFSIIDNGVTEYQNHVRDMENKLVQAKIVLG